MRRSPWRWLIAVSVLLAAGSVALWADPPDFVTEKKAQAAIVNLSDRLDASNTSEMAKKIVAEHQSPDISSIFAPRHRGGLGIGMATKAGHRDSIDALIRDFAHKKTTTEAELEEYYSDYLRVAKVMQAMAELAPYRASQFVRDNQDRMIEWQKTALDFKQKTAAFRKAIEEKDPKKVRMTALDLHHTCCDCHNQT